MRCTKKFKKDLLLYQNLLGTSEGHDVGLLLVGVQTIVKGELHKPT